MFNSFKNIKSDNLNERLLKIVYSHNFRLWFGDWMNEGFAEKLLKLSPVNINHNVNASYTKDHRKRNKTIIDNSKRLIGLFPKFNINNINVIGTIEGYKHSLRKYFDNIVIQGAYQVDELLSTSLFYDEEINKDSEIITAFKGKDTDTLYYLCFVNMAVFNDNTYIFRATVKYSVSKIYYLYDFDFTKIEKSEVANTLNARKADTNHQIGQYKDRKINLIFQTFSDKISKVTDNQGFPELVFHGTTDKFTEFKYGEFGFHFGTQQQALDIIDKRKEHYGAKEHYILPCFLKIINPLETPDFITGWDSYRIAQTFNKHGVLTDQEAKVIMSKDMNTGNKLLIQTLLKKGYDGIKYSNEWESEGVSYIAFKPEHIKLATGENTTFNVKNPDIRFDKGGTIENEDEFIKHIRQLTQNLECDGSTRVIHYLLNEKNIPHKVMFGSVTVEPDSFSPHYWIELPDGRVIDLKIKMWLGDQAQEGIFVPNENLYEGDEIDLPVNKTLFDILTRFDEGGTVMIKAGQKGDCYANSLKYLLENELDDAYLIHGEVTNWLGDTFKHAWVEAGDQVIDPTTGIITGKENYYKSNNAKPEQKYTLPESIKMLFSTKNYGAWYESEISKILKKDVSAYSGGGEVETEFQDVIIWYKKDGDFFFFKGSVYAWLYDVPNAAEKINKGEYDIMLFPFRNPHNWMEDSPLSKVWNKTHQRKFKGASHLIGMIKGAYIEEEKKLYIEMMTVRPDMRRKGINAYMMQELRKTFEIEKDQVVFIDATKQGQAFIDSGKYYKGGNIGYRSGEITGIKPENLQRMAGGRGTGHFGTGYYFFGEQSRAEKYDEGKRELHIVDFDDYILFRPRNFDQGIKVHDALRKFNETDIYETAGRNTIDQILKFGTYRIGTTIEDQYNDKKLLGVVTELLGDRDFPNKKAKELLEKYFVYKSLNRDELKNEITEKTFEVRQDNEWIEYKLPENIADSIISEIEKQYKAEYQSEFNSVEWHLFLLLDSAIQLTSKQRDIVWKTYIDHLKFMQEKEKEGWGMWDYRYKEMDTVSTKIMKALGYQGVDVRGIEGLDNGSFGSVIYDIKPETVIMADGGLIAPNGKKSNLTPEQYNLVRTPEFKAWFGDWEHSPETASKVVDENGEPMPVFHGTLSDFTIFDPQAKTPYINQRKIDAMFFSETYQGALSYVGIEMLRGGHGKILQCFINLRNPSIKDAAIFEPHDRYNYDGRYTYSIQWKKETYINYAKQDGNDGVIFLNAWDNVPIGKIVAVFKPEQIKLADGSNTTFDANNPDIRFDDGGSVKSRFLKRQKEQLQNEYLLKKIDGEYKLINPIYTEGKAKRVLLDMNKDKFSLSKINNRRFIYCPRTKELVLGGNDVGYASHSQEHFDLNVKENIDKCSRGWVGYGKNYPDGIIHFAPAYMNLSDDAQFSQIYDTIEMFLKNGANANTVLRGAGSMGEKKINDIIAIEQEFNDGGGIEDQSSVSDTEKRISALTISLKYADAEKKELINKKINALKLSQKYSGTKQPEIQPDQEKLDEIKAVIDNLTPEQITQIKEAYIDAFTTVVKDAQDKLTELETKKQSLIDKKEEIWKSERGAVGETKYESMQERNNIHNELQALEPEILNQKNRVIAVKNGGDLLSFEDLKGKTHSEVPDFTKISTEEIIFDEDTILTDKVPVYIPFIDEEDYKRRGYVLDAIRVSSDNYLTAIIKHDEEKSLYVMLTLDQLVLVNDYYYTKAKGTEIKKAKDKNEYQEKYWDSLPEARREKFLSQPNLYHSLPVAIKKKISQPDYEALSWQEKEKTYKFFSRSGTKRLNPKLEDKYMWLSLHKMYERFINPQATEPKPRYAHPEVWAYWERFRDMMKWKIKDIRIQREDISDMRKQALETSFGESNTDASLKEKYGILVKRQNGSKINAAEINEIETAWVQVQDVFGNLKKIAEDDNMKISHTGNRFVFASKAIGVYVQTMNTIAISNKFGEFDFRNSLSHEIAHWIDHLIGKRQGARYSTDKYESISGRIAFEFRKNLNLKTDSDYVNATKECFARALEQYFAIKNQGEDANMLYSFRELEKRTPYYTADNYVSKYNFETKIIPLIEMFFKENSFLFEYGEMKELTNVLSVKTHSGIAAKRLADGGSLQNNKLHKILDKALDNLSRSSRTVNEIIDTSACKSKSEVIASDDPRYLAQKSKKNYTETLEYLYSIRNRDFPEFYPAKEVLAFVDDINKWINDGIVKEGVLLRNEDSPKYPYTLVSDLPAARRQFAEEFRRSVNGNDPQKSAAWIHWRVNFTDHFYADGCGKTADALAFFILARHNMDLPTFPADQKEWFKYASKKVRNPNNPKSYYDMSWLEWVFYYKGLFEK